MMMQAVVSSVVLVSCSAISRLRRASYSEVTSRSCAASSGSSLSPSESRESARVTWPAREPISAHSSCQPSRSPASVSSSAWPNSKPTSTSSSSEESTSWSRSPPRIRTAVSLRSTMRRSMPSSSSSSAAGTSSTARKTMPTERLGEVAAEEQLVGAHPVEQGLRLQGRDGERQRDHRGAQQVQLRGGAGGHRVRVLSARAAANGPRPSAVSSETMTAKPAELHGQQPDAVPQRGPGQGDQGRQRDDQGVVRPEDQGAQPGQDQDLGDQLARDRAPRLAQHGEGDGQQGDLGARRARPRWCAARRGTPRCRPGATTAPAIAPMIAAPGGRGGQQAQDVLLAAQAGAAAQPVGEDRGRPRPPRSCSRARTRG